MIKFLDSGVTVDTRFALRALFLLCNKTTKLRGVEVRGTPTIFRLVVVIGTLLQIVVGIVAFTTFLSFESV